ncbi:hypothetical protein R5W23_005639 [Gemmata sp. JC673]|uniref:Uncharacterized protein n=1 Tax=Gemmata algarum TaxID=2975278 RepID=A0ABU5ETE0_9BACT|nr:hypothetical protein [Gemmata algarum]MDY3558519.1 hypothetical protein [Gemmata algarum]
MAWFRCFIRGEGFPGEIVGETGPVGFYVTRFVEAAAPEAAEVAALQVLKADPKLAPPPGYTPSGQARVVFEEIEELAAEPVPAVQPGFAWHPMEG